jgi:hypothetical protein
MVNCLFPAVHVACDLITCGGRRALRVTLYPYEAKVSLPLQYTASAASTFKEGREAIACGISLSSRSRAAS